MDKNTFDRIAKEAAAKSGKLLPRVVSKLKDFFEKDMSERELTTAELKKVAKEILENYADK